MKHARIARIVILKTTMRQTVKVRILRSALAVPHHSLMILALERLFDSWGMKAIDHLFHIRLLMNELAPVMARDTQTCHETWIRVRCILEILMDSIHDAVQTRVAYAFENLTNPSTSHVFDRDLFLINPNSVYAILHQTIESLSWIRGNMQYITKPH